MEVIPAKTVSEQQVRELLALFHAHDESRFNCVFPSGDYVCAVDGRKLVRVHTDYIACDLGAFDGSPLQFGRTAEDIIKESVGINAERHTVDLDRHPEIDPWNDPTDHCSCVFGYVPGTREVCGNCEGFGIYECQHCHQDADCDTCNGNGGWGGDPCPHCQGDEPRVLFLLGESILARGQLEPITQLPEMRIAFPETVDEPVYFSWQYGDGCAMPIGR